MSASSNNIAQFLDLALKIRKQKVNDETFNECLIE